jgi:hypothetical protein
MKVILLAYNTLPSLSNYSALEWANVSKYYFTVSTEENVFFYFMMLKKKEKEGDLSKILSRIKKRTITYHLYEINK